jgi:hypothetical protein
MRLTPPSTQLALTPDFDIPDDYESLVMETCQLLGRTDCQFHVSGFGQADWPVDVSYDLSTVVEQLPATLEALQRGEEAEIDFYGQGIERTISFAPTGDLITVNCSSKTAWIPNPSSETVEREEVRMLLLGLARDFKEAVNRACPTLATVPPFSAW